MALAAASGLSACSGDEIDVPEVPVSYRLTLRTADPARPTLTFSANIDWREGHFIAGMNGGDFHALTVRCGDTWIVPPAELPSFPLSLSQPFRTDHDPSSYHLSIHELRLRPAGDGCVGSLAGYVSGNYSGGDVMTGYDVLDGFECVRDRVGPSFSAGSATSPINPLDLGWIGADELVESAVQASLVDGSGNTLALALAPSRETGDWRHSRFQVSAALAFGTTYTLVASGTDLAWNTGTSSAQFTTAADPGLFAQDGFEGPINAARNNLVKIVDTTQPPALGGYGPMPAPTGQRALAFTKIWSGAAYARFTARLQAPAHATAVKVTYVRFRGQAPDASTAGTTDFESHIVWTIGLPNTSAIVVYDKGKPPVTATPRPWTIEPAAQGATGWFSEPQTLTFPLPAPPVGGEVIFDVLSDQFIPADASTGDGAFILDDLRVE